MASVGHGDESAALGEQLAFFGDTGGRTVLGAVHQAADAARRHFGRIEGREQIEQPLLLLDVRIEPGGEIALAQNDRHAIVIRLKNAVGPGRDDGARVEWLGPFVPGRPYACEGERAIVLARGPFSESHGLRHGLECFAADAAIAVRHLAIPSLTPRARMCRPKGLWRWAVFRVPRLTP